MTAVAGWVRRHPVLAFFLVFAVFPWVVPYKSLATQVLIYGLFALGFNLLYGYTGLLSFGSAALLYLVTEELLVEAHEEPETPLSTATFFAGFLLLFVLQLATG